MVRIEELTLDGAVTVGVTFFCHYINAGVGLFVVVRPFGPEPDVGEQVNILRVRAEIVHNQALELVAHVALGAGGFAEFF
jgi:hypothetical protein